MIPVGTAAEVRALDRAAIDGLGVPGVALMETASHAVAELIRAEFATQARAGVVVVCGPGNNGGDGYACARWLASWGFPVSLWSLHPESAGDAAPMREACRRMGIRSTTTVVGAGLVVDAVFGTGLSREVEGAATSVLMEMASAPAPVVAIDIPSGLDADTGAVLGLAVPATATVTFGWLKRGLVAEPGADLAGVVHVVDIGLGVVDATPAAVVVEGADLAARWPRRQAADHKTRSGHLLVVAGSRNMAGAAVLTCRGALATGAGLVTLAAPAGALPRLGGLPPEVMVFVSGDGDRVDRLPAAALERRTAVVAGPGLGGGVADLPRDLAAWLRELWATSARPVLFDADALPCAVGRGAGPRVITPHPGEAGRLLGLGAGDVQADRFSAAESLAERGGVALLKGRHTLVAEHGRPISVNPTGNPILATGGSGDVLAGVIGALLARGVGAHDAARLGAYVHGLAADRLQRERHAGWTAGDVAAAVPDAIEELCAS